MRISTLLAVMAGVAGVAFGSVTASADGARPAWHFYKLTSLTWTATDLLETDYSDGSSCRTPVRLVGRNLASVIVGARRNVGVGFGKTASTLNFGRPERSPVISARMTLTVGRTACSGTSPGSCAGTYRARGAVIGGFIWGPASDGGEDRMKWSHKMKAPDPLPPAGCPRELGAPIFEWFYAGIYNRGHGGVQTDPGGAHVVPFPRSRLFAGRRFTTHHHSAVVPPGFFDASVSLVPLRR